MQFDQFVDITKEVGFEDGVVRTAQVRYMELFTFEEIDMVTNLQMGGTMDEAQQRIVGQTFAKLVKSWDMPDPNDSSKRLPQLSEDPMGWRKVPQIVLLLIMEKAGEEVPVPFRNTNRQLPSSTGAVAEVPNGLVPSP